ncbi:MAG: flavin reductase family protein [Gammaproteobacteria bacterium]|nr:flavin reductase family protein [Gammaproteobacteria bacterium]
MTAMISNVETMNRVTPSYMCSPESISHTTPREDFTAAMAHAVTGVNIVTTAGPAGRFGVTVSAVSSVSADRPTVLACIHNQSPACRAVQKNGVFCINVLSAAQHHLSDVFAGRENSRYDDKFECGDWALRTTGAPTLEDALATFDCRVDAVHKVGSHYVFIGMVVDTARCDGIPLLYSSRTYGRPQLLS